MVEHKGKDDIREDRTEELRVEIGVTACWRQDGYLSILTDNDKSANDHDQYWNYSDDENDDLEYFCALNTLEWKDSTR